MNIYLLTFSRENRQGVPQYFHSYCKVSGMGWEEDLHKKIVDTVTRGATRYTCFIGVQLLKNVPTSFLDDLTGEDYDAIG